MPTTGPSVLSLIASSTPHHQISLQASEDAINGNTDGPFNHEKQSPWQRDIVILSFSIVHPDSKYDSMGNPNHRGQPRSSFSHTVPLSSPLSQGPRLSSCDSIKVAKPASAANDAVQLDPNCPWQKEVIKTIGHCYKAFGLIGVEADEATVDVYTP